jgi:hypothetical protein
LYYVAVMATVRSQVGEADISTTASKSLYLPFHVTKFA